MPAGYSAAIEAFLRGLAERELRHWDRAGRDGPPFAALARLGRALGTLTQAQLIEEHTPSPLLWELSMSLAVRSGDAQDRIGRSIARAIRSQAVSGSAPALAAIGQAAQPPAAPLAVPLGQRIRVNDERAPCDLHLLAYVRTEHNAAISMAITTHWPGDGSSADLELAGAGPQHLPYRDLALTGPGNARYRLDLRGDGGTAHWHGIARIDPLPPADTGWLDLVADGSRLARLDLTRPAASGPAASERVAAPPWARMLTAAAEQILADAHLPGGPDVVSYLAADIEVLTGAGIVAADSPLLGQLAALCDQLGIEHGIAATPAVLPPSWASVIEQHAAVEHGDRGEQGAGLAAPLAASLPDVDGARFAVAGLTSTAGASILHVIATGPMVCAGPWFYGRYRGCSWWVKDAAGGWHVALARDPDFLPGGDAALAFTLTPPLQAAQSLELVVTGPATRVHATVPMRPVRGSGHG